MSTPFPAARRARWLVCTALLLLGACATNHLREDGEALIDTGNYQDGFAKLRAAVAARPGDAQLRAELRTREDQVTRRLVTAADNERINARYAQARALYQQALLVDPQLSRALTGLTATDLAEQHAARLQQARELAEKNDRDGAQAILRTILVENPQHLAARQLQRSLDEAQAREASSAPAFHNPARKPVTLEFRDANLKLVFEAISKASNINILLDRDVKSDLKTTIFVKDAPVEDAIDLLLLQNQLEKKVVSDNTIFVYPNLPAKLKDYQDLKIRAFQLTNADAKQMQTMLKTLLKTRDLFVDDKNNTLIMRDTPDAIRLAERLITAQDLAEPEVLLEVEVLEVNRSRLEQLGINWPTQLQLSLAGTPQQTTTSYSNGTPITTTQPATNLTLQNIKGLNSSLVQVGTLSGSIDFSKQVGDTNTLSSPRIRVRNKEKANILIGDRVPVITNSVTPTNGGNSVVTGTVTYLDVGLKLDVEPEVHLDDDIAIKLGLEVSNIAKTVTGQSGTVAYQIGTRTAKTVLRLKDGETQILAGLISDDDRQSVAGVDGLSDLPLLGRLFGSTNTNKSKNEIVLTITPHLIRGVHRPDATNMEFWTGTENNLRTRPVGAATLGKVAQGSGVAAAAAANVAAAGSMVAGAGVAPLPAPVAAGGIVPGAFATPPPAVATAGGVVGTQPPPPLAAGGLPFTVGLRAPESGHVGQEISLIVTANAGQAVGSVPVTLQYDPAVFSVSGVTEGDLLRRDGTQTQFSSDIDAANGRVNIRASQPGGRGATGSGTIATVTLKPITVHAPSPISLLPLMPLSPQGMVIPASGSPPLSIRVLE